jgi:hypothetical protein
MSTRFAWERVRATACSERSLAFKSRTPSVLLEHHAKQQRFMARRGSDTRGPYGNGRLYFRGARSAVHRLGRRSVPGREEVARQIAHGAIRGRDWNSYTPVR